MDDNTPESKKNLKAGQNSVNQLDVRTGKILQAPNDKGTDNFLVVGIGASAGGVEALQTFFEQMTLTESTPGIAFVIVMHLSPEHQSNLAAIIQRQTSLRVIQVTEVVAVRPNTVYVIPPAKELIMQDSHIRLSDFKEPRNQRLPVDLFFRTLAQSHGDWAAAIVLSGSGSDGVTGLTAIKEAGGLTLVEDPAEAEYDQMPKNAIATGFVDQVLPVASMGNWLLNYAENRRKIDLQVPTDERERPPDTELELNQTELEFVDNGTSQSNKDALKEILALLWVRTGHNFALYKRPTLNRRLERRMQLNGLSNIPAYLAFLGTHPDELQALLRDLLISVTNFFRDKEVWEYLAADVIPNLFVGKEKPDSMVRVWVAGCATGEEAYTLAILLHEYANRLTRPPKLQVFASDLNEHAIAIAREGSYPETIELDVSPERLNQFFIQANRRYRVKKEVRDTVLFAKHDLLKDPPFSRLDLVTCRNLLIYLNREAQEQVLTLFHFALKPEGYLLLGNSETADTAAQLYANINKKHRLYTRRPLSLTLAQSQPRMLPALFPGPVRIPASPSIKGPVNPANARPGVSLDFPELPQLPANEKLLLTGELHQKLLELYAPPSLVIDENYDIVHLTNRVGRYLQFSGGEISRNLLHLINPQLRADLRSSLHRAIQLGKPAETPRVKVQLEGMDRLVRLSIRAVQGSLPSHSYGLVVFEEFEPENNNSVAESSPGRNGKSDQDVATGQGNKAEINTENAGNNNALLTRQLEEEIELLRSQLQTMLEQYETSIEEFNASHEEMQAVNEELRSATEELETSKEELQAVNEELLTVNQELKINIEEVNHANSDLQNLMVSTNIATIFLNRHMLIKRYTPLVAHLFNIIQTDLNRPLAHITHRLQYNEMLDDLEEVLRSLTPITREVKTVEGEWYLARLLPYRTLEDHIEGVVLTFIDITERKLAQEATLAAHERLGDILKSINDGFYAVDNQWRLTYLNSKAQELWNLQGHNLLGTVLWDLFNPDYKDTEGYKMHQKAAAERIPLNFETYSPNLRFWVEVNIYPSSDGGLSVYFRDISERKGKEASTAFLAGLTEDFARITTSEEIMNSVGEKMYDYFSLSRLTFSYIDEAEETVTIVYDKHEPHLISALGIQRISDFVSEEYLADFRAGRAIVVNDVSTDPQAQANRAFGAGAQLLAPYVGEGQWQFVITMQKNEPYNWRADEIELLEEISPRLHLCLERTRAEMDLRRSEERLQRTIDIETVGIIFFKPGGEVIGSNDAFLRMSGYTREDLANGELRWDLMTPPEYMPQSERAVEEFLTLGRTTPYEKEYIRKDGSRWWALFAATRLDDEEGAEFIIDITESKQGEKALQESEERFRSISDLVPDLLWSNDAAGITDWYNQRWYDYSGKMPEEAMGYGWLEIVHPEDKARAQEDFNKSLQTSEPLRYELRLRDADGNYRWHLTQARPVLDASGQITRWFGATTDIHEQRTAQERLEERVIERTEELRQTNSALQEERARLEEVSSRLLDVQETERRHLARELHDEIGQYLTGLNFMLESIKLAPSENRTEQLNQVLGIVNELTLRVQELSLNLRPSILDDAGLLAALVWFIQRFIAQTGIEVNLQHKGLNERLPGQVETTVYRVVQEALTNVARHSRAKEVSVRVLNDGNLTVLIEDEGQGFEVEKVMERPTSIGLTGMRERVELLGGELMVESAPAKGTTLVMEVPSDKIKLVRNRKQAKKPKETDQERKED